MTFVPMVVTFVGVFVMSLVGVVAPPMFVLVFSQTLGSFCQVVSLEEVYETHYWLALALYIGCVPCTTFVGAAFR